MISRILGELAKWGQPSGNMVKTRLMDKEQQLKWLRDGAGSLTAPQGPVRHWWDSLWGRLFLALVFGEDGKGRGSEERDGHWDIAQSCSVAGRSSGSHSLAFTSWSLKLTHRTCRVVFPWPHDTEHWDTESREGSDQWAALINTDSHSTIHPLSLMSSWIFYILHFI